MKTVIQHFSPFLKLNPHFSDKAIYQATIKRWLKKQEDRSSDTPGKSLQGRMSLEAVDTLVEIVDQRPYCALDVSRSSFTDGIAQLWDD